MLEMWLRTLTCQCVPVTFLTEWVCSLHRCPVTSVCPWEHQEWPHNLNRSAGREELGSRGHGNVVLPAEEHLTILHIVPPKGKVLPQEKEALRGTPWGAPQRAVDEDCILVVGFTSCCVL